MTGTSQATPGGRHRAGAAAPPRARQFPSLNRRTRRAILAGGLAVASATGGIVVAQTASAAVPTFPDNVVVFPDRDFVTIEGYQDHIDETALVEVKRGGQVVGSAQGVVAEGDVAFEINHPGGYCWGAGTGINVTPDIRAGDVVSISFGNAVAGETRTASGTATVHAVRTGTTVKVTGTYGSDVNTAQTEQRIINPDMVTGGNVLRRDVRALPGPLTPSDKGGYSSGLTFNANGTFVATYEFDLESDAIKAASAGGERLMSWQEEDGDGNRQGLTIAEFGESGGPGMGGCPTGPGQSPAPVPGNGSYLVNAAGDSVRVDWTPANAAPDASPVKGYQVNVIGAPAADGSSSVVGKRTNATATSATIPLSPAAPGATLNVEVRALTEDDQMSKSLTVAKAAPGTGTGAEPPGGTVGGGSGPAVTASGSDPVTLNVPAGADAYYTTDGSPAFVADMPSNSATRYTGPIDITAPNTTINWAAFSGSTHSDGSFGPYSPVVATGLPAPTNVSATPGVNSATVTWSAVTGAAKYIVKATPATGNAVTVEAPQGATTTTLNGLTADVAYSVTVTASTTTTPGTSSAPVTVTPTAPTTDRVTIASARWKAGDFRVEGSGTDPTAVLTVRVNGTSLATSTVLTGGTVTWTPPATPGANATFSIRFRNGQPNALPSAVYVTSSKGGVVGPFTGTRNG